MLYSEDNRIKIYSATGSFLLHVFIIILLSFVLITKPKHVELIELDWGSSSGAPNQNISQLEDQPNKQKESSQPSGSTKQSKIQLPTMKSSSESTIPSAKKSKPQTSVEKKQTQSLTSNATISRKSRERSGTAGGAGKSTGYSIEWSGVGSRKLLSGRMPVYPDGTNKEMPVVLQFAVLPDGSVMSIIPLKKSDEILEREAIGALKTWRFDPLPPQFEQNSQIGKITFNFKLE